MVKDYLGNEIKVGDKVIYLSFCRTSSQFRRGTVSGVTEKCAYIGVTRKEGHKIISLTALERRAETAEKENTQLKEELSNWSHNCKAAVERAQQFKRERDAAVEQLHGYCPACAHYTSNHCDGACAECKHEYYQYRSPEAKDKWEWNCGDKEE